MAPPRKPLSSLQFAKKVEAEPTIKQPSTPEETATTSNKTQVIVRMTPEEKKMLKQISAGLGISIQSMLEDAARDIIRRHREQFHL